MVLTVYKEPNDAGASAVWNGLIPNLATHQPNLAFSGLPLGAAVRRCAMHGIDGQLVVRAFLTYSASEPLRVAARTIRSCVKVLRGGPWRCLGLQAQAAKNINTNGTPVGSVTGPRAERLVDIVGYCKAPSLELTTNQRLGTASFTQGSEQVIIPLAALKIKDGPRWIETRDISLIKTDAGMYLMKASKRPDDSSVQLRTFAAFLAAAKAASKSGRSTISETYSAYAIMPLGSTTNTDRASCRRGGMSTP